MREGRGAGRRWAVGHRQLGRMFGGIACELDIGGVEFQFLIAGCRLRRFGRWSLDYGLGRFDLWSLDYGLGRGLWGRRRRWRHFRDQRLDGALWGVRDGIQGIGGFCHGELHFRMRKVTETVALRI